MGKNKVAPKVIVKRRFDEDESPVPVKTLRGCPCPGMKGCTIGRPVSTGDDSVTLICSALSCPFEGVACHRQCFEKYEDQLLKALGDKGSARGWTPYKARRNLWKNNGQGLIAMCCRCICEKGNVRPPEEVVLAERILVAPVDADRKKKTKKKDLPVINMNGGANIKQARMQARMEKEENEAERLYNIDSFNTPPFTPRRTRNSSVTSFSSQSIVSSTSTYRTTAAEERAVTRDYPDTPVTHRSRRVKERERERMNGGEKKRERREESRARLDSGVSLRTPPTTPSKEIKTELIPAANPPPLFKSYAATIKSDRQECIPLTPFPSDHGEITVDGGSLLSPPITPPSASSSTHSICSARLPEAWYTKSSPAWEIAAYGLYPTEVLQSHVLAAAAAAAKVGQSTPAFKPNCGIWNPWEGRDFELGQFRLCGINLPSRPDHKKNMIK